MFKYTHKNLRAKIGVRTSGRDYGMACWVRG